MNLNAKIYNLVQRIITGDSSKTYGLLKKNMGFLPGDRIVDIGCGTGLISKKFTTDDIKYVGCDPSADRIAAAKIANPEAQFFCGTVQQMEQQLPSFAMVHGVLHHISDDDVKVLLTYLKKNGCKVFGAMEPERPFKSLKNILGTIYCDYVDDGDFIRSKEQYVELLSRFGKLKYERFRWPLLPIHCLILTLQFYEN